jgi:hypothetical protein
MGIDPTVWRLVVETVSRHGHDMAVAEREAGLDLA